MRLKDDHRLPVEPFAGRAASEIAHDVMPQGPARVRRAGDNHVVFAFLQLREDFIEDNAMSHPHLRGDAESFEFLPLRTEVLPKFGTSGQERIHVFLEADEVGVDGGRLRHDVEQGDGSSNAGR